MHATLSNGNPFFYDRGKEELEAQNSADRLPCRSHFAARDHVSHHGRSHPKYQPTLRANVGGRRARIIRVPAAPGRSDAAYAPYLRQYVEALETFTSSHPWEFFNFHNMWQG